MVTDRRLGHAARSVYLALALHADAEGVCWPSDQAMAEMLGMKRQAVQRCRAQLARLGYLEWTHTRTSNQYRLEVQPQVAPEEPGCNIRLQGVQHDVASGATSGCTNRTKNRTREQEQPGEVDVGEGLQLGVLARTPGYPFDLERDTAFIRELAGSFPEVDLDEELQKWALYIEAHPYKKGANPRLGLRNWIVNARRFGQEREARPGPRPAARNGTSPPRDPKDYQRAWQQQSHDALQAEVQARIRQLEGAGERVPPLIEVQRQILEERKAARMAANS